MTSPISGISGIGAALPIAPVAPSAPSSTPAVSGPSGDFASMLASGLENLQQVQGRADDLAVQAANGTLTDPAAYTMASTEAALATQLTVAVRNKAVEAFTEIMRMQA
ncbi:flagellar hook-basal body complex protein FliE [Catenuloplanes nepalensis]|uniref:Flagellar hook-basal body complex protein FliE n=1 Tax=Catenuloplanes nepalensis TaxID=587533 RepID=A0ABT9N2X0_9ACTN|nr:flagellar hook-basal body complex protein FliE [Catenuloplanes nepalensis]MDP9798042.1 flagellar hook-basal body complex protein FliE [Catenuloplanes nepalensis]